MGRADDGGEGEAVGGGGGAGTGAAVILKGCEQVATPPARTLQHRNPGNFIRRRQRQQQQQQRGCSGNTCKCMKAHTWCHIDAPGRPFSFSAGIERGKGMCQTERHILREWCGNSTAALFLFLLPV